MSSLSLHSQPTSCLYSIFLSPYPSVRRRQAGILEKYGVELIGAKLPSIDRAEDRLLFKNAMTKIGLKTPTSGTAENWAQAIEVSSSSSRAEPLVAQLPTLQLTHSSFCVELPCAVPLRQPKSGRV